MERAGTADEIMHSPSIYDSSMCHIIIESVRQKVDRKISEKVSKLFFITLNKIYLMNRIVLFVFFTLFSNLIQYQKHLRILKKERKEKKHFYNTFFFILEYNFIITLNIILS